MALNAKARWLSMIFHRAAFFSLCIYTWEPLDGLMCAHREQKSGKGRQCQAYGRQAKQARECTLMKHLEKRIHWLQLPAKHIQISEMNIVGVGGLHGGGVMKGGIRRGGEEWNDMRLGLSTSRNWRGDRNLWERKAAQLDFFFFHHVLYCRDVGDYWKTKPFKTTSLKKFFQQRFIIMFSHQVHISSCFPWPSY